jgi:hypothetical protein
VPAITKTSICERPRRRFVVVITAVSENKGLSRDQVLLPRPRRTTIGRDAQKTVTVTMCGRICFNRQKINLSTVFAGHSVGIKQVSEEIWLVTFMDYDLGYFDHEACRLEPLENPFGAKVLPMSPEKP